MAKLIAEIGINHSGDSNKLIEMIEVLNQNHIDSCKLQYRKDEDFFHKDLEMGSTLVAQELRKVNVSENTTLKAIRHCKKIGLEVGVSFFRSKDAIELCEKEVPDFFKVPSAEALNFELIKTLQSYERPVLISTGGLTYDQLLLISKKIKFADDDSILYCVANYPVAKGVSIPGYISEYQKIFNCPIGYSSHDENWEANIGFLANGAECIERHFTINKADKGLDISTSSDIEELKKLQSFCRLETWKNYPSIKNKVPNQGEVQNIKDLGSGYYFDRNYKKNETVNISDLVIRSPCRGINVGSTGNFQIQKNAQINEAVIMTHMEKNMEDINFDIDYLNELQISLPIRPHDVLTIDKIFNLKNYEWHLSYVECENILNTFTTELSSYLSGKQYSLHLPDYISSNHLIDPISSDLDIRNQSRHLIGKCAEFANHLEQHTGQCVPIVGSFSECSNSKINFYQDISTFISEINTNYKVKIMPQFLPRMAWYFGGSVMLNVFCSISDIEFFKQLPFGICLDTAHCIMAANYENQDSAIWISNLLPIAKHIHISDAKGVDGEGVPFGFGDLDMTSIPLADSSLRKVVEQWEGHLHDFKGFKEGLSVISMFK